MENLPQEQRKQRLIQSKLSKKGEIPDYLSRMGDVLKYIVKRHRLQACFGGSVHILLNRNKCHAERWIDDLCQPSHFHLFTTEAAKAFHDDRADQAVLYHFLHLLKTFPLECSTWYAVIHEELGIPVTLPTGVVL